MADARPAWGDKTTVALRTPCGVSDPSAVSCSLTWWHGKHDANAPIAAVQRLTANMGGVDLRLWSEAGHLESYHRHDEILAKFLAR
jgi:hypothetical protein